MKVAFNTLPLKSGHKTRGIGSYTKNLVAELNKRDDLEVVEYGEKGINKKVDIIHYPFFDLYQRSLPLSQKYPTVVTIHDLTPLVFASHYPAGIKGKINFYWQKFALRSVNKVITDSISSQQDIIKYLNLDEDRVVPVYLAAAEHFRQIKDQSFLNRVKAKYSLPDTFALYSGNVNWNKNLLNIARSCQLANIDLVLVGKSFEERTNLDHPELRSFKQFLDKYASDPKIHILGFVSDEDLVGLYNLAAVTLLPSYYEGFGLTILESQRCGTPVITGNNSSMLEVGGESVLFVDPQKAEEISQNIVKVINDKSLRQQLITLGLANVKKYSWEKTAEQTVQVYKSVLKC